ncbi:recombinase family protein [Magnetospirillum moscoviense]|uniref:Resolvase n=1 Tax=Magnetospirillum moscoviense TaxID=1437059 RepID=A0A178MI80_9PROT|nr:recombinase family protein [Magnetospirillum moscoviense]OAN48319.1 resolvase [Magnetospirillum moscoviense]
MAVYGYTRVSTDRQADEGESLDVQRRQLEGYALMHGMALDTVYVERGVSGSKPLGERPEGGRLISMLKAGDVVLTPKLDRMFRSSLDALDNLNLLKGMGVSLHMLDLGGDVTGNGISKLVFTILSAVAEAERDRIRERIVTVKADQRERGRYLGGRIPFGWRVDEDGGLVEIAEQQAAILTMVAMKNEGLALRTIAERMTAQGFKLSHEGVKKIIASTLKAG